MFDDSFAEFKDKIICKHVFYLQNYSQRSFISLLLIRLNKKSYIFLLFYFCTLTRKCDFKYTNFDSCIIYRWSTTQFQSNYFQIKNLLSLIFHVHHSWFIFDIILLEPYSKINAQNLLVMLKMDRCVFNHYPTCLHLPCF